MLASRSKWPKFPTPRTPTPTWSSLDLPPQGEGRGLGSTLSPPPSPSPSPSPTHPQARQTAPPPPHSDPPVGENREGPEEPWERGAPEEQGRPDRARRKRCRAQQKGNSAPGKESLWLLEAPVRKVIPQVGAGVGKPPHGLGGCIWMHLVNGTGNGPSPGQPTPG